MGEYDQDQDYAVEPTRPPLTTVQAREVTAGLRKPLANVRRPVPMLAVRVWGTRTPP
ncbi:hypothetical protein [Streptomyces bobili]